MLPKWWTSSPLAQMVLSLESKPPWMIAKRFCSWGRFWAAMHLSNQRIDLSKKSTKTQVFIWIQCFSSFSAGASRTAHHPSLAFTSCKGITSSSIKYQDSSCKTAILETMVWMSSFSLNSRPLAELLVQIPEDQILSKWSNWRVQLWKASLFLSVLESRNTWKELSRYLRCSRFLAGFWPVDLCLGRKLLVYQWNDKMTGSALKSSKKLR